MTITAEWNADDHVWTVRAGAEFTLEEVLGLLEKTHWGGADRFVWDLSALERGPSETTELREVRKLLEQGQALWGGSRFAVIVARDFDFGIGRMFQSFVEGMGIQVKVFREPDHAFSWIRRGGRTA